LAPSADDVPTIEAVAPPPAAAAGLSAPAPSPLPSIIGSKYRPIRFIASGGMGAVYEVVHANTGQRLALKVMLARSLLAPELVARFRREARIQGLVKSEHIVQVFDADVASELDGAPFLVMELLEGFDLERVCLARAPSAEEVVDWMRQLAPALDRAHQEGIVHRDLKPENIFLAEREGEPPIIKILDFGVAKVAAERAGNATVTGQILGTPRYMAPEQAAGAKEISAAADRFALGLIAFRLLCGRHYFSGDNWVGLLREVARGPRQRPSAFGSGSGRAFDAWFARACAFDPAARFATCESQAEALAGALTTVPARRRIPVRIALAACGLAGLVWGIHRSTAKSMVAIVTPTPAAAIATPPRSISARSTAALAPTSMKQNASAPESLTPPVNGTSSRRHPVRPHQRPEPGASGPSAKVPPVARPAGDRIWTEP
jgi:serine/threonine protein kinase